TWEFNAGHYDIFRYVDISNYSNVWRYYSNYAKNHKGKQKSFEKFSTGVNCYGDNSGYVAHEEMQCEYGTGFKNISNYLSRGMFGYASGLMQNLSDKGVKIYYTYAAMDKTGTGLENTLISEYTENLLAAFPQITVISDWKNCLVEHNQIYDSIWHLTLEGAHARTMNFIKDIKAQLDKEGK
ncbi:MAG: hypothetical protein ACI4QR_05430, partial [Eubacteriales bacterium]